MVGGAANSNSRSFRDPWFNAKQAAFWAFLGGWLGLVLALLLVGRDASTAALTVAALAGFAVVAAIVVLLFERCKVEWQSGHVEVVGPFRRWTWDPDRTEAIVSHTLGRNMPRFVQLRTADGRCVNIVGLPYDRRDVLYSLLPAELCRRSGFTMSCRGKAGTRWFAHRYKTGSDLDPDEGWKVVLLRRRPLGTTKVVRSEEDLTERQSSDLANTWLREVASA